MTMRSIILFAILATTIFVSGLSDGPFTVELLEPHGFRILRPGLIFPLDVEFRRGSISRETKGSGDRIPSSPFKRQDDGLWVYENTNVTLHPGDTLSYQISESTGFCGVVYIEEFHVPVNATEQD